RVGQVRPVLSASPDYIARRGRPRTPRELRNHDIVFTSDPPRANEWRFRASGRQVVVRLTPRFVVTEVEAALSAVWAGCGITRSLSSQVADHLSSGALVRVLREFELSVSPVYLVFPSARHMPRTVRAFLDVAALALDALRVIHVERP